MHLNLQVTGHESVLFIRGQKARGAETPLHDPDSGNPFSERPSTARQNEATRVSLETALAELDKTINCPENVEPHVWERMCRYRRQKVQGFPYFPQSPFSC